MDRRSLRLPQLSTAALLILTCGLPLVAGPFYVDSLSTIFIYSIAGAGLTLLCGVAGQISIGHAAFIGIGAYLHAFLLIQGVPFAASLAISAVVSALCGLLVALPVLRMNTVELVENAFEVVGRDAGPFVDHR